MKILMNVNIETEFIKDVIDHIKTLELKEDRLSQITFQRHDDAKKKIYSVWHNKKSFSVHYHEVSA